MCLNNKHKSLHTCGKVEWIGTCIGKVGWVDHLQVRWIGLSIGIKARCHAATQSNKKCFILSLVLLTATYLSFLGFLHNISCTYLSFPLHEHSNLSKIQSFSYKAHNLLLKYS